MEKIRPPLKWPGGKRWLVPYLKPIWEQYKDRRLVEPFCGGLAITLGLMPKKALLNDINPHSINLYKWLKRGLKITVEMKNDSTLFYSHRKEFNSLITSGSQKSKKAAGLFYYLNRTCYNGLCRFNNRGEFNAPFGKYANINYKTDFSEYKRVFSKWTFIIGDFENVSLNKNDFVYADPPYDVEFTQYSKENFLWKDQERLAKWLNKHKNIVILSNQATERIIDLYKSYGFKLKFYDAPRMISCTGDRKPAKEVLAIKGK